MNGWHLSVGLLIVLGYVFHRMDSRLAWERQHHEEAVARWRSHQQALNRAALMHSLSKGRDIR